MLVDVFDDFHWQLSHAGFPLFFTWPFYFHWRVASFGPRVPPSSTASRDAWPRCLFPVQGANLIWGVENPSHTIRMLSVACGHAQDRIGRSGVDVKQGAEHLVRRADDLRTSLG
jgi:hypothetical protein